MDLYEHNYEVWQLVFKLSQAKEKYRLELENERKAHNKTKKELTKFQNKNNSKIKKIWKKLFH